MNDASNKTNLRVLVYFVHPAKVHLFRETINRLKADGIQVDILINSKDVLEDLVRKEGWEYQNLFPKGRNKKEKPSIFNSARVFILTLFKIERFLLRQKRYCVFLTDDSLVVSGWWRKIPSIIFNDNDINTIKINSILFNFATLIISPEITELGKFKSKKHSFKGNKSLAHLHPNVYKPDSSVLEKYGLEENNFCIIRTSKLNATHDAGGNNGLEDNNLINLFDYCVGLFKDVLLVTERKLPSRLNKNVYKGDPSDLKYIIYYAAFMVTDSGTMATEAAVLGVPNYLLNKLAFHVKVHNELFKAGIQYYFYDYESMIERIKENNKHVDLKLEYQKKAKEYIKGCDDLNHVIYSSVIRYAFLG
ncbi:DUF354 domain-containing protein [Algoriphagus taiwanensis]